MTWDPAVVLGYLKASPDRPPLFLTWKLATLMLLASGQRVQTLVKMERGRVVFSEEQVTIFVPGVLKTTRRATAAPAVHLPFCLDDPSLCVPSYLQANLDLTQDAAASALFLNLFKRDTCLHIQFILCIYGHFVAYFSPTFAFNAGFISTVVSFMVWGQVSHSVCA